MCNVKLRIAVPFIVALVAYLCPLAMASEKPQTSALPVEEALKLRSFGQLMAPAFSPDGKWLAYTIRNNQGAKSVGEEAYARTGVPSWALGTDICIVNTETGEIQNLTGGQADNWLPVWSPDGQHLAFISDRDSRGQARLWTWARETNRLSRVSNIDVRADKLAWTPDSHNILLTSLPDGLSVEDFAKIVMPGAEVRNSASKSVGLARTLYQSSLVVPDDKNDQTADPWNLERRRRDLYSVEVRSGKAFRVIRDKRIETYVLSPDGFRVAYTSPMRFERPGSQQILFDLVTVDMKTNQERVVDSEFRFDYDGASFSWSPNGLQLSFQAGGVEERMFDCYVVDAQDGSPRNVTTFSQPARLRRKSLSPLWDVNGYIYFVRDGAIWRTSMYRAEVVQISQASNREIRHMFANSGGLLWSPDEGKSALALTYDNLGKQDGVYRIGLANGQFTKLFERGQCYTCANLEQQFAVSEARRLIALFAEDAEHDEDLWISDVTFEQPRRLTYLNPQLDKYNMGAARLIDWLSDDGERLQGVLLLPSGYQDGKRYPLVVWVYGGESLSNDFNHFGIVSGGPFNMQLLATRGYAVFFPDAPQHLGTPMFDLAKAVLPGVNKVIEMGVADPTRLGLMGHSYGGYSTLALIVQTKRFKAAIEVDGPGDLLGFYGAMNKDGTAFGISIDEQGQGLMGGTPWQFRSRYIENSPIFFIDRLETPLLIIHGAEDDSVGPFLGDQLFVSLRRLGKEAEYVRYEREEHSPLYWSYENQVDLCNRMIAWFDKYLKADSSKSGSVDSETPH